MQIDLKVSFFYGNTMNETSILPEVKALAEQIELQFRKSLISCEEASKFSGFGVPYIYRTIREGKLAASGKRNKKIPAMAFAKWLHGQDV